MNDQDQVRAMENELHDLVRVNRTELTRENRPTIAAVPRETIGAVAVGKRLEELQAQAQELLKAATVVATALAGTDAQKAHNKPAQKGEHLFARQMSGLDGLGQMLDSVRHEIDRAARSLT